MNPDIYFVRAKQILERMDFNPMVKMEVFSRKSGILCGIDEAISFIVGRAPFARPLRIWALEERMDFSPKEVVMRIEAPVQSIIDLETDYLGILASCSAWATAARECCDAAGRIPVVSFGARHIHPDISARMDVSAIIGGCSACSSVEGARLSGKEPIGTMPHALILVLGDTTIAMERFNEFMSPSIPRVALVDTFKDEVIESLDVAIYMKEHGSKLEGVRLDTPSERGGVTPDLVKEVRAHLDMEGFTDVKITVSGGITPERIRKFIEEKAPIDVFGIGSYISGAKPIDFTADIHEIGTVDLDSDDIYDVGCFVAKRGRIPGVTYNQRLRLY